MATLSLHRVAFAHVDAAPLFADVELRLAPGFHGLVGPNGAGKTTLLRLFSGEIAPDAGHVRLEPADATVAICSQIVDRRDPTIDAFAIDDGGAARALRGRLALDPASLARWPTLSPGERKRWQVGAALASDPDVLLLDEPTNHLDAEARALLLGALRRFYGVGVVVAHDRAFLDALTGATLRIDRGAVTLHPGSFSKARAAWELQARARQDAHDALAGAARAAKKKLTAVRVEHASSARELSAGHRMKGPRDHDARGGLTKYRVGAAEARVARRVGVARADAARAFAAVPAFEVDPALGRSLFVDYAPAPRPRLLSFDGDLVVAGRTLLAGVHVAIARGERVKIEGPNGAGKTTLVEAMLAAASLPTDRVLHVRQDVGRDEARGALEALRRLPSEARGRALSLVAALGVDPDRLLVSGEPSPGEAPKLAIAAGLARHVWVAVLDEPTNHLDLPAIERLERALAAFPGALVVVSHDESFLEGQLDTALALDEGRIVARTLVRRREAR